VKHLKYFKYLCHHKWYVFKECWRLGISWRGLIHDWSKFLPSEWFPYVEYFYGDFGINNKCPAKWVEHPYEKINCSIVSRNFDIAWLYHQKRNKHHWQYWVLLQDSEETKYLEIPQKHLLEMAADWIGASKTIRGKDAKAIEWYNKVKEQTFLNEKTRIKFERLLK